MKPWKMKLKAAQAEAENEARLAETEARRERKKRIKRSHRKPVPGIRKVSASSALPSNINRKVV